MAELENITIRTLPQVLAAQAAVIADRTHVIEERFQRIEEMIGRSASYWSGDGGDAHRRVYRESKEGIEEVLADFRETSDALETIARRYGSAESTQTARETGLPSDVIT